MKRIGIFIMMALCILSCTNEEAEVATAGGEGTTTLTLTYTIPDAIAGGGTARSVAGGMNTRGNNYVESTANESLVGGLHLLFFKPDIHGNGAFVARTAATLKSSSLKENSITVSLPTGVNKADEYDVLVIANLGAYLTINAELQNYLKPFETKTYGQAMAELQLALLEKTIDGETTYDFRTFDDETDLRNKVLPMSGTTVKPAGKDAMSVNLLRAAVRIDVSVKDYLTGVTLNEVQLRNISPVIPYFRTQEEITVPRVTCTKMSVTGNQVTGGLYAVETNLDVSDPRKLLSDATCLLVNITRNDIHTGDDAKKTWYRINLNVNAAGMQYLKRNNAYTVVITGIYSVGAETPEEAYNDKSTVLESVTIPTDWNGSGVTPPDVVIQ